MRELTADTVLTNLTGSGTITCSAAQPVTLTLHSTAYSEFNGTISGAIRIVKTGTEQLRLTSQAASSFSGGLEIEAGIYSQVAAVGSGPITVRGNGGLVFMVGGTLTNQLTFAESGQLGVWRGFTLTLRQMPDMRKAKVTFTDGGTFYFPAPLTDAVAGGTVFAVDKGVLSLPANVFGAGDGLLVSSLSLTAGSLDGGMSGNVQGYLSRLHARGTVTLPDLSLAGGRRPLTGWGRRAGGSGWGATWRTISSSAMTFCARPSGASATARYLTRISSWLWPPWGPWPWRCMRTGTIWSPSR